MSNYTEKLKALLDGIENTANKTATAMKKDSEDFNSGDYVSKSREPDRSNYRTFEKYNDAYLRYKAGANKKTGSKEDIVLPNRKNYNSFREYNDDFLSARAGTKVFKNGAYNHGVDADYIKSLDDSVNSFAESQAEALKNASFGDFSREEEAKTQAQAIRDSLQALKNYRGESELYLAKPTDKASLLSTVHGTSADGILKRAGDVSRAAFLPQEASAKDFSVRYDAARARERFEETQEEERDGELVALDSAIDYVESTLESVEAAWAQKHETYDRFEGDEKAYNNAVLMGKYGDLTYDELQKVFNRVLEGGPVPAEDYEYLTNYGIMHGFDDVESYDKAIAELERRRAPLLDRYTLDSDDKYSLHGYKKYTDASGNEMVMIDRNGISSLVPIKQAEKELREADEEFMTLSAKISALENDRDTLAAEISAWTQYSPFVNAEDYGAMSRYRERTQKEMGGAYYGTYQVARYLNSSNAEKERLKEIGGTENLDEYDEMDEEQIKMLNYLLNTQGGEAARVYLDALMPVLQRKARATQSAELAAYAKEHPVLGTLASFGTNAASVLATPAQMFYGITGNDEKAYSYGEAASVTSAFREGAMRNLIEEHGWNETAAEIVYGGLTSIADNLIAAGIAGGVPGKAAGSFTQAATQLIMSSEAASSAMTEALDRGLSSEQAALFGLGSGAIEALTEKYSIEALLSKPQGALDYFLKNTFTEGAEEIGSEVLGEMWDRIVAGDRAETVARYNELVAGGMSAKDASREVLKGKLAEVAVSFASGALAGAGSSAPAAGVTAVGNRVEGNRVNKSGDAQYVVSLAARSEDASVRELAARAQAQLDENGKVADVLLGQMLMGDESLAAELTEYRRKQNGLAREAKGNSEVLTDESPVAGEAYIGSREDTREAFDGVSRQTAAENETPSTVSEKLSRGISENEAVEQSAAEESRPIVAPTPDSSGEALAQASRDLARGDNAATTFERRAVKAEDLAGEAKKQAQSVERAAKLLGREVGFYSMPAVNGKIENGYYDRSTGRLYVNVYAKNPYSVVFGHELTHSLEKTKTYSSLETAVRTQLESRGAGELERLAYDMYEGRRGTQWEVSLESARREVVADYLSEEFFGNEEAITKLVRDNRNVAYRIQEAIRSLISRITGDSHGYGTLRRTEMLLGKALREADATAAKEARRAAEVTAKGTKSSPVAGTADGGEARSYEKKRAELGERYRAGEISEEEFDELWDSEIESDPEYRADVDEAARAGLGMVDYEGRSESGGKRFSVSDTVEEADGLIAIHNLDSKKLESVLKLGGFPSPSIAVTGVKMTHDNYGDISVIFPSETIDPQTDTRNRVYVSDAWTPTASNARVEYRVDADALLSLEREINELSRNIAGGIFSSSAPIRALGIEEQSSYTVGEAARRLADNDAVKAAYLAENGRDIEPVYRTKEYSKYGNEALQLLIDRLGAQRLAEIEAAVMLGDSSVLRAEEDTVRDIIRESYEKKHERFLNRKPEQKQARIDHYMKNNVSFFTVEDFVTDAWEFFMDGGAGTDEIDRLATSDRLNEAVSREELTAWLEEKLSDVIGEAEIYNDSDFYNSDGTRKSFDETHWEYTAENIVRAMANASERGETWADAYNGELLAATASPSYSTLDEIREDSGRLRLEDKETHRETLDSITNELEGVVNDILRSTKHHTDNTFEEKNLIGGIIVKAAQASHGTSDIKQTFADEGYTVSDTQAQAVAKLYDRAAQVPTGYFEAKPQRVVGLDEAAVYIIPNDTDPKLKGELLRRGLNMAEYDRDVEGSRQKVVNDYERYSFSVSDENREAEAFANYSEQYDTVEHASAREELREKRTGGRFAGFEYAEDALHAIREHMLTRDEEREVAEQLLMPEVDGEVVIPYRTWLIAHSLGTYERRSDGKKTEVAGIALPIVEEDGVWLHIWDNELGKRTNKFFPLSELSVTTAEHSPSYAELQSMEQFAEELAQREEDALTETDAGLVAGGYTAEDMAELEAERKRERDEYRARREAREREIRTENDYALTEYLATHGEEVRRAAVTYDSMSPNTKAYFNRSLAGFRRSVSRALGIPNSRVGETSVAAISDVLAAEYLRDGSISESSIKEAFNALFERVQRVKRDFYDEYSPLMKQIKDTRLVISKEDAADLPDGYTIFRRASQSRLSLHLAKNGEAGNVDTLYAELSAEYPELFPEGITHPADELRRIFEAAREIAQSRNAIETPDGAERAYMEHEFGEEVSSLTSALYAARERTLEDMDNVDTVLESEETLEEQARKVLELGREMPKLIRNVQKMSTKVLLTVHDEGVVRELLTGRVTEEEVHRNERNAANIIRMYEARKPYEAAAARMKHYRARINTQNRETASQMLGDISRWHDPKHFAQIKYNIHDFTRIARLIAPDSESAQRLIDTYITPIKEHNADAVRYMDRMRERVKALKLSRNAAKGDAVSESAAVQLLGEARAAQAILRRQLENRHRRKADLQRDGLTLEEWIKDEAALWEANPTLAKNKAKLESAAEVFSELYREILNDMNLVLARNALAPIPERAGYFPHYAKEQKQGVFDRIRSALGIGSDVLPTSIAGLTGDFRPNRQWFANAMSRENNSRESQLESLTYDAVEGFDSYIETAASLIYHTGDISRLRALETQVRYETSDEAVKREIRRIQQNETLTEEEKQDAIAKRTANARTVLSGFASFLLEYTNKLAGKKSIVDRGVEALFGRDTFTIVKSLSSRYAVNATSSLGSAVTNFLPWAQGSNGYGTKDFVKALVEVARGRDATGESYFIVAREGSDRLAKTKTERASEIMLKPFELIDGYVSKVATQARYNKNLREKLSEQAAIDEASAWAAELFADRSQGSKPLIFESHNPIVKAFTQFQLEVNNQLLRTVEDMPRETREIYNKSNNKALAVGAAAKYWGQYALSVWLLNGVFEKLFGRGPGGDYLGIILDAVLAGFGEDDAFEEVWKLLFGDDDEYEDEKEGGVGAALSDFGGNIVEEIPFVGSFFGGGRVPIASAFPTFSHLPEMFSGDVSWQNKLKTLWSDVGTSAMYFALPFGAAQLRKTATGLADVIAGGAYNYDVETGEGKLKYPVAGAWDAIQATVFGSSATEGSREWVDNGFDSLNVKQTNAYEAAVAAGMDAANAKRLVQRISSLKDAESGSANAYEKLMYLDGVELDSDVKAALYRELILPSDSEEKINASRELLSRADELGVTEGRLYEELVEIERIKEQHKGTKSEEWTHDGDDLFDLSGGDGESSQKNEAIARYLWDSEILESAKPAIWAAVTSDSTREKLVALGMSEEEAAATEWDMANLLPVGTKTNVSAYQKARVVLEHGGSSVAAANMLSRDDRRKVELLYKRGIDPEAYISVREYLLYIDDNGSIDQDEARRAINAVSKGVTTAGYGYSGRALELKKSEKAAIWQCINSGWSANKNPFNTTVGANVQKDVKKSGDEEAKEGEKKSKAQKQANEAAYYDKYGK